MGLADRPQSLGIAEVKIYKAKDEVLRAVLAEIHKSVQKPDKGFLTIRQWAERWGYKNVQAGRIILRAVKVGILIKKNFRVCTKGRVRVMGHYGLAVGRTIRTSGKR